VEDANAQTLRGLNFSSNGKPVTVLSGLEGLLALAQWSSANFVLTAVAAPSDCGLFLRHCSPGKR